MENCFNEFKAELLRTIWLILYSWKTCHPPFRDICEDIHPIFHPQDLQLFSEGGIALHLALQLRYWSSFDLHVLRRFYDPCWIYQKQTFSFNNDQEAESCLIKEGGWPLMKSSVVRLMVPSELFAKHLYWPISSISTLWICREPFFRREYLSPSREPSGSSLLLQNKHWTLQSSSEIEAHGKGLYWNEYRCSVDKTESNVASFFFAPFFLPRLWKLTKGFWKETFQRRKQYKWVQKEDP